MGQFRQPKIDKTQLRSWLSVGVVALFMILLVSSLGRVLMNARNNYDVYLYEQQGLSQLQNENSQLQNQLDYYQSYEYKKLYARDQLYLVEPGERLYRLVGNQQLYDAPTKRPDFFASKQYLDWWLRII